MRTSGLPAALAAAASGAALAASPAPGPCWLGPLALLLLLLLFSLRSTLGECGLPLPCEAMASDGQRRGGATDRDAGEEEALSLSHTHTHRCGTQSRESKDVSLSLGRGSYQTGVKGQGPKGQRSKARGQRGRRRKERRVRPKRGKCCTWHERGRQRVASQRRGQRLGLGLPLLRAPRRAVGATAARQGRCASLYHCRGCKGGRGRQC